MRQKADSTANPMKYLPHFALSVKSQSIKSRSVKDLNALKATRQCLLSAAYTLGVPWGKSTNLV